MTPPPALGGKRPLARVPADATSPRMPKGRLEAFSDGVLAIIITILVLELKVPHAYDFSALVALIPTFLGYVLSFVYVGIYWNNHHHMFHVVTKASGSVLWANLHLLLWLSLVPFATGWLGESRFAAAPTFLYGTILLGAALAYLILQTAIIRTEGEGSRLKAAIGRDLKGKGSGLLYVVALGAAFVEPMVAHAIYLLVACIWLIPDRRMEAVLAGAPAHH